MTQYKWDGTPISSNTLALNRSSTPFSKEETTKLRNLVGRANETHLATVREVLFADDIRNQSKYQVEYVIRIEFGPRHGQEFESVQAINLYGGNVNFSETIYFPKTQLVENKTRNAEDIYMYDHDASQVVVAFMDGFYNQPFIIGGWHNTNTSPLFAAKKVDGCREIKEFNGIRLETNKDGEYILTYHGGQRNTKTKITAQADTAPTTFKIDKNGVWTIDDKENQEIKVDRVNKKITITQFANVKPDETYGDTDTSAQGAIVNQIIMDKAAKTITLNVANTQATVVLDGVANKIILTAGSTLIEIDGATGKISLTGDLVDVGAAASALAALGPQMVSWLKTHTHLHPIPLHGAGSAPTSPPIAPPPATLLSTTVKIKA